MSYQPHQSEDVTLKPVAGRVPYRAQILAFLPTVGGFATGEVARHVSPMFGHNQRIHSAYVRQLLLQLEAEGKVRRLDDQRPVCWQLVAAPEALREQAAKP